jgi:Flp pilus assembly protein TadG
MQRKFGRFNEDESGASLLELTVVLPVLLVIGMGAIEFGMRIYREHLVFNGVRDAARFAAGLPFDPGNKDQYKGRIQSIAVYGNPAGSGAPRVTNWTTSDISVDWGNPIANGYNSCGTTQCYRGELELYAVTVSTTFSYPATGLESLLGLTGNPTLSATHQERVIGVR